MFKRRMAERRRDARYTSFDFARILLPDGLSEPFRVLDRSTGGMRIAVPSKPMLPQRFVVELISSGELVPVAIAWRKSHEIGLKKEYRISA